MIEVTSLNAEEILSFLSDSRTIAFDTETTGLRFDRGDKLFALILADYQNEYYFNFQDYPHEGITGLKIETFRKELSQFFTRGLFFVAHNAKFDMHALCSVGITPPSQVYCTMAAARIEYNDHMKYSLDACAKRIGLEKSDAVEEFVKKHHLWAWEEIPGKKSRVKNKRFDKVPYRIISEYACKDARIAYELAVEQEKNFQKIVSAEVAGAPSIRKVLDNETKFTQTCFEIEARGICIDRAECERSIQFELSRSQGATREFEKLAGVSFVDSAKTFAPIFGKFNIKTPSTDKGNQSFTDEILSKIEHPLAKQIQLYRDAHKKLNSYYRNFIYWSDEYGVLHPDIRQSGTASGRISTVNPALQTIPKKDDEGNDEGYKVRKVFVPRKDFLFVEMDYKAMEFRMLVDYAGEKELAKKIEAGHDPHQATADLVGVDRRSAKTISFGLLYGMGVGKLSASLNCSEETARELKTKYFRALPKVKRLIYQVGDAAKKRGYVRNWMGRRSYFPDSNFAYKAVNYLIQGGGADVVKLAMNQIRDILLTCQSKMILQIHDAILFEIHKSELDLIPHLKQIMVEAYPHMILPMDVSIEYSFTSWGELVGGLPSEQEARDHFQREGAKGSSPSPKSVVYQNTTEDYPGDPGYFSLCPG